MQWIPWSEYVPKYVHDPEKRFNEILVPTKDTVRNTWLLDQMVKIKQPILFVGDSGTSKTATIQDFLRKINQETHVRLYLMRHSQIKRWNILSVCIGRDVFYLIVIHNHVHESSDLHFHQASLGFILKLHHGVWMPPFLSVKTHSSTI